MVRWVASLRNCFDTKANGRTSKGYQDAFDTSYMGEVPFFGETPRRLCSGQPGLCMGGGGRSRIRRPRYEE